MVQGLNPGMGTMSRLAQGRGPTQPSIQWVPRGFWGGGGGGRGRSVKLTTHFHLNAKTVWSCTSYNLSLHGMDSDSFTFAFVTLHTTLLM
jgi:hypothetical protein